MGEHELFRNVFLAMFALHFAIERTLAVLNARFVKARRERIPEPLREVVSPHNYTRSIEYTLARLRLDHVSAVIGSALILAYLFTEFPSYLYLFVGNFVESERFHGVAYLAAFAAINAVLGIPLELYETFRLEARFGFNKTTFKTYLLDKIKGVFLALVLGVPFLYVLTRVLNAETDLWWLWAALFVIAFQIAMMGLFPVLIAPLFNKFTPLQEGELKTRLEELARRCEFATRGIFVVDGSLRSTHSNAYFADLGKARRIVLYDTLVQQLAPGEISAVLAHEIGHFKKRHIPKMILLSCALTLAGFFVLSLLIDWRPMYQAFYVTQRERELGLVLFLLVSGSFTFWVAPLVNWISRKHEYEADAFAREHSDEGSSSLESALLKLFEKNLATLTPHPAYSAWHYSHPALIERLEALRKG